MAANVHVEVNEKKAVLYLERMEFRQDNKTPVWHWARREMERANAENFSMLGLPSGAAWDPLSPKYGAWKAVNHPGAPLMIRSGKLFESLTNLRGSPNAIRRDSAEFGTRVEYAKFHQRGTFKMPKRQIIFEPPLFATRLAQKLGEYIVDGEI